MANAIGRNTMAKNKKRRLSMLTNSFSSLSSISSRSNLQKDNKDQEVSRSTDTVDSAKQSVKRKLIEPNEDEPKNNISTSSLASVTSATSLMAKKNLMTTPLTSSIIFKPIRGIYDSHALANPNPPTGNSYNEQLIICNSFVYATCRDALNDEEIESK